MFFNIIFLSFRITERLKEIFVQKAELFDELKAKKDLTITALHNSNRFLLLHVGIHILLYNYRKGNKCKANY